MSNSRRLREDPWSRGPCGCLMRVKGQVVLYRPCSPDCPHYLYARKVAEGKRVAVRSVLIDTGRLN